MKNVRDFRIGSFYLRVLDDGSVQKRGQDDASFVCIRKYPRAADAEAAIRRVWPEAQEIGRETPTQACEKNNKRR